MMVCVAVLLLASLTAPSFAQAPPQLDRLQRADGARVVPDRFLRRWDPVTIMFDQDTGPAAGGPEDAPERLVTLSPPQPGAWQWVGARALQFRPAEPWRPLARVSVLLAGGGSGGAAATRLVPLLPTPVATGPADSTTGTADLDTVLLQFTEPVEEAALARLLAIELRPQPGLSAVGAQALAPGDFDLRPVDRASPGDKQSYLLILRRPVPDDRVAVIRLRLSDEPGLDDPSFEFRIRSAAPFRLADTYCGDGYTHETKDNATRCAPERDVPGVRTLALQFTAEPEAIDIVRARDAIRITPPVDDLAVSTARDELRLSGRFQADTVYDIAIAAGALRDKRGRPLSAAVSTRYTFAPGDPRLVWDASQGLVERFGPQMVPLRGRGYDRADLRIHPIDPLSRDFWPFPRGGLTTSDDQAPPLPGNEPRPWAEAGPIPGDDIAARVQALGSPAVSELVSLPIRRGGVDAKFGLDLAPMLRRIAGDGQPGTYLLGLRTTDGAGAARRWARVQVTDLSLTTVEESDRVRFVVTSLATAQPVAGAEVAVEGVRDRVFATLARGVTGADGSWTMPAPLALGRDRRPPGLRRYVVTKGADTLVLEPGSGRGAPKVFSAEGWQVASGTWLGWTAAADITERQEAPRLLCHLYTERPIYRPEEPVLVAGMIRRYRAGGLNFATGGGEVVVTGPDDQEWRVPATLDDAGGFHVRFTERTEATGDYRIAYVPKDGEPCGEVSVKKEAYRLPTFEVVLNAPSRGATLDTPFQVDLLARWFAGGMLSDRPITWRVTQFPLAWTPPAGTGAREGYLFSSDSRYSGDSAFRSTPVLNREGKTDAGGSAALTLDPTVEPTAQPRQYLVEATVTGDDDIQVRATQRISALPPFVLGVKVPRYLPDAGAIEPEVVALDAEGKELAGLQMRARLVRRNWNSILQASDFAQGSAKYQTQILDETVEERQLTSGAQAEKLRFEARDAGVYVVELEAEDRAGRRQQVKVDLFMAGGTPVTWSRPPSETVTVTTDKESYAPGETATLLVQSPFQSARALAVIEEPEGRFRYEWLQVSNGFARLSLPVRKPQVPKVAVHFLVMRGRLPGTSPAGAPFDQGKPVTLAATKWVTVQPVENQVRVAFEAPATARPGQEVELLLRLSDAAGKPLAGEATVWMVDQAVLALAREQPLDPLPAFLVDRPIRMAARDTRSMAFGVIPLLETPGGDEAGDFGMENITVRKNFTPVPLYLPRVRVGPDGLARIRTRLPDTLTVYMLRAKAISGPDRFGYGRGEMRIRQPVVAQPALPRFVRPGDQFQAALVGRIVEGPGGAGRAAISLDNLAVQGAAEQSLTWDGQRPARVEYSVSVPEPPAGTNTARVRFLLQRLADRVSDGVQIDLPIRPDRSPLRRRDLMAVGADDTLLIPPLDQAARPASYRRGIVLATDPTLVRLVNGLGVLARQPYGGTEQRISLASAELAFLPFTPVLQAAGLQERLAADVAAAAQAIRQATDDDGLVGYWPRTPGSVWLTAQAYRFLAAADRAGQPVDKAALERMGKVLQAALRSDYPRLLSGEELRERVAALQALTEGGQASPDYAAELARRAPALPTESAAQAVTALARQPETADRRLLALALEAMWGRVNLLNRDGRLAYAGLQDSPGSRLIFPSEARSLAEVLTAASATVPNDPRTPLLRTALLGLAGASSGGGAGDPSSIGGWGNTNATAAALRALAAAWQPPTQPVPATIALPDRSATGMLDQAHPLLLADTTRPGPVRVQARAGITALVATDWVPAEPGAAARAAQNGFVLTRTLYRVPPPPPAASPGVAGQAPQPQGTVQASPQRAPMERLDPGPDGAIQLAAGDVVEEVAEIVSPEDRAHVALRLPLAAGLEPLNPNLATAPAEAAPSAGPTLAPSWSAFGDDEVQRVWLTLPRGTYTMRHRMRATVPGAYTQPPATVGAIYQPGVDASTAGQRIVVAR